jgi:hypothetical protein
VLQHGTAEHRLSDLPKVIDEEVLWTMDHASFLLSENDAAIVQGLTCATTRLATSGPCSSSTASSAKAMAARFWKRPCSG